MGRQKETAQARAARLKQKAEQKTGKDEAAEAALDERVRRNIDLYGP
jgi:hypothetical protein